MSVVVSLLPKEQLGVVPARVLARAVAREVEGSRTLVDYEEKWLEVWSEYGKALSLEFRDYLPEFYRSIWKLVHERLNSGMNWGSETAAVSQVLGEELEKLFPCGVPFQGWLRGEKVRVNGKSAKSGVGFVACGELTGRACERCGVNPEVYGSGGGVRCLDEVNCGWWYCA